LLAMGLGENGSNILSSSLKNNLEQEINTIIEGEKTVAVYCYCEIQDFYEIFKVLKENVLIFVNEIAEIVHCITDENFGFVDKNIGEAFSLIWRIDENFIRINPYNNELEAVKSNAITNIIQASVITIIKIIMEIYKTGKLYKVLII